MSDEHKTCDQLGRAHDVDAAELAEARENGGGVRCLVCSKVIQQGPRNLEFRAEIER